MSLSVPEPPPSAPHDGQRPSVEPLVRSAWRRRVILLLAAAHATAAGLLMLVVVVDGVFLAFRHRLFAPDAPQVTRSFSGFLGIPLVIATYLVKDTPRLGYSLNYAAIAPPEKVFLGVMTAAYLGLALLHLALAFGLRRLWSWARWVQIFWLALGVPAAFYHAVLIGRWAPPLPSLRNAAVVMSLAVAQPILAFLLDPRTTALFSTRGGSTEQSGRNRAFRFELVFGIFLVPLVAAGLLVIDIFGPLVPWARFAIWFAESRFYDL